MRREQNIFALLADLDVLEKLGILNAHEQTLAFSLGLFIQVPPTCLVSRWQCSSVHPRLSGKASGRWHLRRISWSCRGKCALPFPAAAVSQDGSRLVCIAQVGLSL